MSISTFNPEVNPDYGASSEVSTRVLRADFGDGYSTRAADGLNSVKRKYNLKWSILTNSQANTIDSFLSGLKGSSAFYYTFPSDIERKFVCTSWTKTRLSYGVSSISCSFEEVFDIV